jgi:hypothetical protein
MSKILRVAKIILLTVIGLIVMVVGVALGYRDQLQHGRGQAIAMRTLNGIDEGMVVRIGRIDQRIQIRGPNRNPSMSSRRSRGDMVAREVTPAGLTRAYFNRINAP